jgi:hypothetical protein
LIQLRRLIVEASHHIALFHAKVPRVVPMDTLERAAERRP